MVPEDATRAELPQASEGCMGERRWLNPRAPAPALRHRLPDRLDWYTLRSLLGPLLLCAVRAAAGACCWSGLLRLFDMAASTGASSLLVLQMAASLVPHYLGMAVPVAFFAAIFMAVARTGDDNELDAMLATGRSITRMAAPYFLVAAGCCASSTSISSGTCSR